MTLETWEQVCRDAFGDEFTHVRLSNAVHQTNINYGGFDIDVSNTVFVHGNLDPWHPLGIRKSISNNAVLIMINGTSHCDDVSPGGSHKDLTKAKQKIGEHITKWLSSTFNQ